MKKELIKKWNRRMPRVIAIALCLILTAGILVGCGEKVSDEEMIRQALTEELDSIKNMEETAMEEMGVEDLTAQLEPLGIAGEDFMKTYLEGFDCTIGDITVDGDHATATVTLKCKSFNDINTELQNVSAEMMENPEELAEMSEEEIMLKMGEVFLDITKKAEVKETAPIEINYELIDKVWTPTAESDQNIAEAMLGN